MARCACLLALLAVAIACSSLDSGAPVGGDAEGGGNAGGSGGGGGGGGNGGGGGGEPTPAPGAPTDDCAAASECELAGTSCCGCPSFAVPIADGWGASCEDVSCPSPGEPCPAIEATCAGGACAAECAAVACQLACAQGFARDALGCLRCACAEPLPPGAAACAVDADCARVPADCCGCEAGGADTAVPQAEVGAHLDALACDRAPICPGVDVCDPGRSPRCIAGQCALVLAPAGDDGGDPVDPQFCGTPDASPCVPPAVCMLNAPGGEAASQVGVGACQLP